MSTRAGKTSCRKAARAGPSGPFLDGLRPPQPRTQLIPYRCIQLASPWRLGGAFEQHPPAAILPTQELAEKSKIACKTFPLFYALFTES